MTVSSEAEAVRQAKEYLDIGFVVNAIKRPDGSIAHDQDQLSALHHGFDDLALKLAEERTPKPRRGVPSQGSFSSNLWEPPPSGKKFKQVLR